MSGNQEDQDWLLNDSHMPPFFNKDDDNKENEDFKLLKDILFASFINETKSLSNPTLNKLNTSNENVPNESNISKSNSIV